MKGLNEFVIPLNKKEILHNTKDESFSYAEVSISELPQRIKDFESDCDMMGPAAVLENFSILCTLMIEAKIDQKMKERGLKKLLNLLEKEQKYIKNILENEHIDSEDKKNHRNIIKVLIFLLCGIIELGIVENDTNIQKPSNKRTKKNKVKTVDQSWIIHYEKYMDIIHDLFELNVHYLWLPPIIDEDLIRLIVNFCFIFFENNDLVKVKTIFNIISSVLGLIISKYNGLLGICLKIVKNIQHIDNQHNNMAYLIEVFVKKFSCSQIIVEIFKEFSSIKNEDLIADNTNQRNCSLFLSVIGKLLPNDVLINISLLMCHLEYDPYYMRNGVLDCLGYIIIHIFSKNQLDDVIRKNRDHFFDKIQSHVHDINAYVRSHALQILCNISQHKAIPINRFNTIVRLTTDRLDDKSCNVRKNAASLLHQLILFNPYSTFFNIQQLQSQLKQQNCEIPTHSKLTSLVIDDYQHQWENIEVNLRLILNSSSPLKSDDTTTYIDLDDIQESSKAEILNSLIQHDFANAIIQASNFIKQEPQEDFIQFMKRLYLGHASKTIIENELKKDDSIQSSPTLNTTTIIYVQESLSFALMVNQSTSIVYRLLQSDTINDIIEIVHLLLTICKYGIITLKDTANYILPLIWTNEPNLKLSVIQALSEILCVQPASTKFNSMLDNIFFILRDAPICTISALEELFSNLSENDLFPSSMIQKLWKIYSSSDTDNKDRHFSIMLLGMLAKGSPVIIKNNFDLIASIAFSDPDYLKLAIFSCDALVKYAISQKKCQGLHGASYDSYQFLLKKLINYVTVTYSSSKCTLWSSLCELSLKVIISISNRPIPILNEFAKNLYSRISYSVNSDDLIIDTIQLGRFIHAICHIGGILVVFLEGHFLFEIKRRSQIIHSACENKKSKLNKSSGLHQSTENAYDELQIQGATSDETENEFVRDLCENEITRDDSIFSKAIPLINHILEHQESFPPSIVSCALLGLMKLMLLNQTFCSKNLQIVFTIMKKSNNENLRINAAILIGDIIQRYPNLIEPWMPNMFLLLRENCVKLRKTVLSVLSSLILNDMVKVKGHISELVFCIEDSDSTIAARTRYFFQELSRKDNAIYNILPDIISRLSDSQHSLDQDFFQKVMKFFLTFLQKEKQCESLVEKLLHRFALTNSTKEVMDLVFCLNQLNLTERSFRKIIENFSAYKDKLHDDQVYQSFLNILHKFKKNSRDHFKTSLDEFEVRLLEAHRRGLDKPANSSVSSSPCKNECTAEPVLQDITQSNKRCKKMQQRTKKRNRIKKRNSSLSNDSETECKRRKA